MPATRYAYFIGQPVEGKAEQFFSHLEQTVAGFSKLPGVKSAQLERPCYFETGAPEIYATVRISFNSLDDIEAALATPERQRLRAEFKANVAPLFEGTISHINYEAKEFIN
jgi:hypothetical protein